MCFYWNRRNMLTEVCVQKSTIFNIFYANSYPSRLLSGLQRWGESSYSLARVRYRTCNQQKKGVKSWFHLSLADTMHWPQCWQRNSGLTRSAGIKKCFPCSCANITPLQACTAPPAPVLLYVSPCVSGSCAVVYHWVNIRDKCERLKSFIQLFRGEELMY